MGLFSPWFLAGLAALSLPLWLHLLRQFKRTPQPFSSLMFFERKIQSSSKHRRLRYLWLLAFRMALLALLALLFANPFINRAATAVKSRKLTVIVVDHSFSMRYQSRLADAKAKATQFVTGLTGSRRIEVIALASRAVAITQPETTNTTINKAIAGIEATDETSSYGELARALRVLEQSTNLSLDVHLFTDAQQTSMPNAFTDLQLGPHSSLTIHEIGEGEAPNWAVQSVNVPSHIYDNASIRLIVGIAAWQSKEATRKATVLLDGHAIASKYATIPSSGRAEIEFTDLAIPYGAHRGLVQIEPRDDLPNDDSFSFSIERSDPRKVLFLHGMGHSAESFFYKSALNASTNTGLRVQSEPFGDTSSLDLTSYALVVLNNPGDLEEPLIKNLTDYVSKGGSVFIAVGPATARAGTVPIAGNRVSATNSIQGASKSSSEIFDRTAFDKIQFLGTARIATTATDRILARFADGSPLLLERAMGEGKLMVFASTLDNSTSDFPVHASFLPFVANTGAYLSGADDHESSIAVGSAVALRQSKSQSASADVIGPNGTHEISLSNATRIMNFNPDREGFYDVHPASGKPFLIAVHADRRESDLTKVPPETLILWRNTSSGGAVASESNSASSQAPFSLWRYILSLVLIAAVVESIFAIRYLSEERRAA